MGMKAGSGGKFGSETKTKKTNKSVKDGAPLSDPLTYIHITFPAYAILV